MTRNSNVKTKQKQDYQRLQPQKEYAIKQQYNSPLFPATNSHCSRSVDSYYSIQIVSVLNGLATNRHIWQSPEVK